MEVGSSSSAVAGGRARRQRRHPPTRPDRREEHRRLALSLLLSLAIHGLLLSLSFEGGQGFGLPGLAFFWQERRIEAPGLQVVLLPARQPEASAGQLRPPSGGMETTRPRPTVVSSSVAFLRPRSRTATAEVRPKARTRDRYTRPRPAKTLPALPKEALPVAAAGVEVPAPVREVAVIALEQSEIPNFLVPQPPPEPTATTGPAADARILEEPARLPGTAPAEALGADPAAVAEPPAPDPPRMAAAEVFREAEERRQALARLEAAEAAEAERQAASLRAEQAEQARLEAERQEAARRAAAAEEARRRDAAREEARREAERLRAQQEEDARRQAAQEEARRQEAARLEAARREAERREAEWAAAAQAEAARLEAERQEATMRAAAAEEAMRREAERLRAQREEDARRQAAREQAGREEAARKEAARLLAEQEEDARREARRRAMGRELEEAAARRQAQAEARAAKPLPLSLGTARRARLWGRADANAALVRYAEAWARKIHFNTPPDMVRDLAKRPHTQPLVTVAMRNDGSVESVTLVLSSGVAEVDEAIRRIVHSQVPFPPFPPELARDYDVVEIRRTWHFDTAIRLY